MNLLKEWCQNALLSDNSQSSAGVKLSVPLSIGIKEGSRFIYASAPGGNVAMEMV